MVGVCIVIIYHYVILYNYSQLKSSFFRVLNYFHSSLQVKPCLRFLRFQFLVTSGYPVLCGFDYSFVSRSCPNSVPQKIALIYSCFLHYGQKPEFISRQSQHSTLKTSRFLPPLQSKIIFSLAKAVYTLQFMYYQSNLQLQCISLIWHYIITFV